jgi:hypothetical protein
MHSTGSIIYTILNRIRSFLDEPTLDAKFNNDYLVRHVISPEMGSVFNLLLSVRENPIITRQSISFETDSEYYELPPSIAKVHRVAEVNADGSILTEIPIASNESPDSVGWFVEGRELHVRPLPPESSSDYDLWFTPASGATPHYSTSGGTLNVSRDVLTLDLTPTLGDLDHRPNAYIGSILRVWVNEDGEPPRVHESVITSHAIGTSGVTVTLRTPAPTWTGIGAQDGVQYEILPLYMDLAWQAVAVSCAINLGVSRNISEKQMVLLQAQLQQTLKSVSGSLSPEDNKSSFRPDSSILHAMVSRIKKKVEQIGDDVSIDVTDDFLVDNYVIPETRKILSAVNQDEDAAILVNHSISTVAGAEHYLLPPNVTRVLRVAKKTNNLSGKLPYEEVPKNADKDPYGHGYRIEGNRLSLIPTPNTSEIIYIWYVPGGDIYPHFAVDGSQTNASQIKLSKGNLFSSLLGRVDRREGGYLGSVVRLVTSSGSIEDRVITGHTADDDDGHQGYISVTEEFTGSHAGRTCTYEILPAWWSNFENSVVDACVFSLSSSDPKTTEVQASTLAQSAQVSFTALLSELKKTRSDESLTCKRNSMLHCILEKTQKTLSNLAPDLDYSSDFIMRQGINNELGNVVARINNTRTNPYTCVFEVTTVKDQQYYPLPANIGEITRIVQIDDTGRITSDLVPKNEYSWSGPTWNIEGNMLSFRPYPSKDQTFQVWYLPSSTSWPHYAENGSLDGDRDTLTLTDSEWGSHLLGNVDHRDSAYTGYLLRIVGGPNPFEDEWGAGVVEERIIKSHDAESGTVTVERPFSSSVVTGTCKYEIVPLYLEAVNEAVISGTIANLSVGSKNITERQQKVLYINYRSAMKTAGDLLSNMQGRVPKHYSKDTVDNRMNRDLIR